MPPSCGELQGVATSPRSRSGSIHWTLHQDEQDDALVQADDGADHQQELCACAKEFEDDALVLDDEDEGGASSRLRALSILEQTCGVCQRSQIYYRASTRAIQRRRSLSICESIGDADWESDYRSSSWWMLGVMVALLAAVCAFVSPSELSTNAAPIPILDAMPSLYSYLLHGSEPAIPMDSRPPMCVVRDLLHRAHVVIHSTVTGRRAVRARTISKAEELDAAAAHVVESLETELVMDIYCRGPLLHTVQMAGVFSDSKHFVDMPIKTNSCAFDVLVDFERRELSLTSFAPDQRPESHVTALRAFLNEHFDAPGSDLLPVTPVDFVDASEPPRLAAIRDPALREWAMALHRLWRSLGRVPHPRVQSSLLRAKPLVGTGAEPKRTRRQAQNVLIVPGGRFRESYYWDSYWIVHGLLASNMHVTARGVVDNLLEYAAEFGFVPNGGRVYYLTRSQPPMLSEMVRLVSESDADVGVDKDYLGVALPVLEREYAFWMRRGPDGHAVEVEWRAGNTSESLVLNRYTSASNHPRPESYREDMEVAAEIFDETVGHSVENTDTDDAAPTPAATAAASTVPRRKEQYYNDVIAATESGWDFSSRWLREPLNMKTIATANVLPVDLNAVLFRMECNLMRFYTLTGNASRSAFFREAAEARRRAMDLVLWSEASKSWRDLDLATHRYSRVVSVSDYAPLWAGVLDGSDSKRVGEVVASLRDSGLVQVGGVQATTTFSGQQWDAPNAWSPSQDMLVEGLLLANTSEATAMARDVARTWVRAGLTAFQRTGLMFEKYNATEVGGMGVGGEYFPQFGFGWTNGVVLKFLTLYQHLLED
jgi:alpha,alpha-trehalase